MRSILALVLAMSGPAWAVELIEMKDGRLIEVQTASVEGEKLLVERILSGGERVRHAIPIERVLPECVYYAWAGGLTENQSASWVALAEWARANGLFRHARKAYQAASLSSAQVRDRLPELDAELHNEEATWLFLAAEASFGENDVKVARVRLERILADFGGTGEVARATALLSILAEREAFLNEQKRQDEIAARARKHRREMDKALDRVGRADRMVLAARIGRPEDAMRRLRWAAYSYRAASIRLEELLASVEVDELRLTLDALLDDMAARTVRTFLKLGDLRFVTGDVTGALEAVHEVLAVDPGNKEASGLRDRVLEAGSRELAPAPEVATYPVYRRRLYSGYAGHINGFGVLPVTGLRYGHGGVRFYRGPYYPFPCR